jgi:hypothetical protein
VKQVAFTFGQADAAINNAKRVVRANTGPLEELDLLTGLLAYLSVTDYLTEEIMDMLGVREHLTPTGLLMEGRYTQNPCAWHFERDGDFTTTEG